MEIKVLGPGCKNCKTLERDVQKVVGEMGIAATVLKIENPRQIVEMGVMATPGLIINGKIKSTGRIPKSEEIARWIREEQNN
ncbi:MAG: thioredoxin family protein [Bacillota bacterium]